LPATGGRAESVAKSRGSAGTARAAQGSSERSTGLIEVELLAVAFAIKGRAMATIEGPPNSTIEEEDLPDVTPKVISLLPFVQERL
jgi:hypothetical protein